MNKTTGEGWKPYSLDTLVLSTLLCVLKATDEIWDQYRLISQAQKSLFYIHKTTHEGWTSNSSANHAVLQAKNDR